MVRRDVRCRRTLVAAVAVGALAGVLVVPASVPPAAADDPVVVVDSEYDFSGLVEWDSETTYHVTDDVEVPGGGTLSVPSGAVVKLADGVVFTVNGAMTVEPGEPRAVFTSVNDDTRGEVIDGSSGSPAAGDWDQLRFGDSSAVVMEEVNIRFGGTGESGENAACRGEGLINAGSMVEIRSGADVAISHSSIHHAPDAALVVLTPNQSISSFAPTVSSVDGVEIATSTFADATCGMGADTTSPLTVLNNTFDESLDTSFNSDAVGSGFTFYANELHDAFRTESGVDDGLGDRDIRYNLFLGPVRFPDQAPDGSADQVPPKMRFNWWGHGFDDPEDSRDPEGCVSEYPAEPHFRDHPPDTVEDEACPVEGDLLANGPGAYFTTVFPALWDEPDAGDRAEWAGRGRDYARQRASDPVDTATGAFVDERSDLNFVGEVPGMDWGRAYSSMDVAEPGLLGPGWMTSMEPTVAPVDGAGDPDERDVAFRSVAEDVVVFDNTVAGEWARPEHVFGDLHWNDTAETFSIAWDDGSTWAFTAEGRLGSVTDWAGRTATLTWDSDKLTGVASSLGYQLTFDYGDPTFTGRITTATASLVGHDDIVVDYGYDSDGDLETVTRDATLVERYVTDEDGRIEQIEVPSADTGMRTKVTNSYDDPDRSGRVTSQIGPNGAVTTFVYYDAARATVVIDEESGDQSTYVYDPDGQLVSIEDTLGSIVERTYTNGTLTGVVDRRSNTASRSYDQGRLTEVHAADGAVTEYGYDGSGRLLTATVHDGETGYVTTYGYEGDERVPSSITGPAQDGSPVTLQNVVDGRVEDVIDPDGVHTRHVFNETTETLDFVVVDPDDGEGAAELDLTTGFGYDTLGRQDRVTIDPGGLAIDTVTTFDPLTLQVETVTEEGESPTTYLYNDDGTLKEVTDPTGAVTTYAHDPDSGQQTAMTQLETIVEDDERLDIADAIEFTTTYGYNGSGEMDSVTRPGDETSSGTPLSPAQTTTYDLGELARMQNTIVDPAGTARKSVFAYDADGNQCRTTVDPRSGIGEACTPETVEGEELNRSTVTSFDEAGRPESVTDPLGHTVSTVYDDRGLVAASTDATGRVTRHTYDGAGRQLTMTVAMDDVAAPVTVETRTYTPAGRLETVTTGSGDDATVTVYGYDAAGRQASATVDPGGLNLTTTTGYDAASRPTSVTSPSGIAATTTYAVESNQRSATTFTPGHGYTRTVFSARDEVVATERTGEGGDPESPDATVSYRFDDRGNLAAVTDANGNVVTYTTDGRANRLTRTSIPDDHDVVETWEYNAADELVVATRPVDLDAETPVYRETSYTYTAAGEIDVVADDSGRTTDYDYLADGTVDTVTYTDTGAEPVETRVVDFGYDDGERTSASVDTGGGAAETVYGFGDESGQVTSVDGPGAEDDYTIGYDTAGRRTSLVSPDGVEVAYGYDAAGRLETVDRRPGTSGEVTTYSYDADGNLTRQDLPDPSAEDQYRSWSFDPATGLLEHFDEVVDGTRVTTDTAFDGLGRLWIDYTDGTVTTYSYDDADQLVGVHRSDSVFDTSVTGDDVAYAYDGVGNRTARVQGPPGDDDGVPEATDGTVELYDYDDANQLVRVSSSVKDDWSYGWDGAGRLTEAFVDNDDDGVGDEDGEQRSYAYDPAGLLTEATTVIDDSEWVDTRAYGPDGVLSSVNVVETGPGEDPEDPPVTVFDHTFEYVWDTALAVPQPLQVFTDQNEVFDATSTFVNGLGLVGGGTDRVSAHVRLHTETPVELDFYLATDVHGSTIPTEGTAGFVRSAGYDEFGNPAGPVLNNPQEPALGYRGELQTVDTVHLRARAYTPWTARFTVPDPLDGVDGTPTVANGYHYGDNDPVNRIDPLGLRPNDGDMGAKRAYAHFAVPRQPGYGRVRANLFIAAFDSGAPFFWAYGNGRDFSSTAGIADSKATIAIDFETGRGEVAANYTCWENRPWPFGGTCYDAYDITINPNTSVDAAACGTPDSPPTISSCANANQDAQLPKSWLRVNASGRTVDLQYRFTIAGAPLGVGPGIEGKINLATIAGSDRVAWCVDRDPYPSLEIYQDVRGATRTLARVNESRWPGPIALSGALPNHDECRP